jgi:hypothetical protein
MKEKIEQLISYAQSSLYFANEAFNEIWCITQTPNSDDEYKIVSGPPFSFYGITLQYCFVMEYTKLLDKNTSNENKKCCFSFEINKISERIFGEYI